MARAPWYRAAREPDWDNYASQGQSYLDAYATKYPDKGATTLTGEHLAQGARRTYETEREVVPVDLALSQGQFESEFGRKGRSPVKNPFNVGEEDTRTTQTFETTQEGVDAYYNLMARKYLRSKNMGELLANFTNTENLRYATDPDYETKITNQVEVIRNFLNTP